MSDDLRGDPATVPNLPADRTFIVQFRAPQPQPATDPIVHGRVEHVVSGMATRFDTWRELETFVEVVLLGTRVQQPTDAV